MKVYIAGPMTGYPDFNRPSFFAQADAILANGDIPLNPAILPDGLTQAEYMSLCLPMVMLSDAIYLLAGWEASKGAVAEHALATKLGIDIVYLTNPAQLPNTITVDFTKPLPLSMQDKHLYIGFKHGTALREVLLKDNPIYTEWHFITNKEVTVTSSFFLGLLGNDIQDKIATVNFESLVGISYDECKRALRRLIP